MHHTKPLTRAQIITYQFAYIPGTINLCDMCACLETGLGAVSHGQHSGECDLCGPADRVQATADMREYCRKIREV
jgi:hypothetical protein